MFTTERTVRVIHAPHEHRSASTTSYLKNQWLPSQPTVQREIRESLRDGRYDGDRGALCADLQRDPATLFQFLKALPGFQPDSQRFLDPLAAVQELPKPELTSLLDKVLGERSVHRVGKGSSQQKEQILRSILTSTAAQSLSAPAGTAGEINAGVVAHLRNLGRMLVAWNYPRIFRRATQAAKHEGVPVDASIERILGVAPQALGFSIAREWGLHPEILRCLVFDPRREQDGDSAFHRCGQLCGLSEGYVDRIALSEDGGKGSEEGSAIEEQLRSRFGDEILGRLQTSVAATLRATRQRLQPERGKEHKPSFEISKGIKLPRAGEIDPSARRQMEEFITSHAEHSAVRAGLEEMISAMIPTLGFSNGCLYLLDKSETYLVPVVQIGERKEKGYPNVDVRKTGLIAESLFANHPVVQDSAFLFGEIKSHVTGPAALLGQRIVLSLCWKNREDLKGDPGALFQGISACLESLGDIATLEKL